MLVQLVNIARKAGQIILGHYQAADLSVDRKSDNSPVTVADKESSRFITDALQELTPDIPVISEEEKVPPYSERKTWDRFWLVDPLDGTKEFISRNGEFTVNIALVEEGIPTYGVIHIPTQNLTYYASKEQGAWKKEGEDKDQQIFSNQKSEDEPKILVESRSHPAKIPADLQQSFQVSERLGVGSSIKFCMLAEGKADVYPRFAPAMEWDLAAGDCIYRYSAPSGVNPSPIEYNSESLKILAFVLGLPQKIFVSAEPGDLS